MSSGWSCYRSREPACSPCIDPEPSTVGLGLLLGTDCLQFQHFQGLKTPYNTSQTARHCSAALLFVLIITVLPVLALYRHPDTETSCPAGRGQFHSKAWSHTPKLQGGSFPQGCGGKAQKLACAEPQRCLAAGAGRARQNSAFSRRFTNVMVFVLTCCWCSAIASFTL